MSFLYLNETGRYVFQSMDGPVHFKD